MHVRSVYVKAPWQCEVRDVQLPALKPGWARIRVEACGICGTDQTAAVSGAKEWEALGHEVAGVIEELAPGVTTFTVGQKVVLESASFCGVCSVCRDGRVDLCHDKAPNFWGQPAMGMSDRFMVPAACLVPYEGLSAAEACLVEPAGVAYDLIKTADIQMGDRVLLVGPGPIGLAAIALAKHRGAARLIAVGTKTDGLRMQTARELGAETRASTAPDFADLGDLDRQFDHVLMTAPTSYIAPALRFLAYGGEMSYIGIGTGSGMISFDANDFHFRKLQLRASFASPAMYYPAVLRLMAAGIIPAAKLISHRFPIERAPEAFGVLKDQRDTALKIVITPGV